MWQQWRKATNYIHSLKSYEDMGPDLAMRRQVNQDLEHRHPLSLDDWCYECQQVTHSPRRTLLFVYRVLEAYSGIEFNRVRPHDRLVDDLQFPLVCWFDWSASFCDDVVACFGIDVSDCFDETHMHTLADLITFLDGYLTTKS